MPSINERTYALLPGLPNICSSSNATIYGAESYSSCVITLGLFKNAAIASNGIARIAPSKLLRLIEGDLLPPPLFKVSLGCPSIKESSIISPGYIKCGLAICSLACQISGQRHGVLRNRADISQSVSPVATT